MVMIWNGWEKDCEIVIILFLELWIYKSFIENYIDFCELLY